MSEEETPERVDCGCDSAGGSCCKKSRLLIPLILAVGIVVVLLLKSQRPEHDATFPGADKFTIESTFAEMAGGRPTLVELGSTTCVPCQMMKKVLTGVHARYGENLNILFFDVTTHPNFGRKFSVNMIPTQVFLDAIGNEVFRHEGYLPEEQIVAKWEELGIAIK